MSESHDDRTLEPMKQALQRQLGTLRAPAALHERSLRMLRRRDPAHLWRRRLTLAAVLTICVAGAAWASIAFYQHRQQQRFLQMNDRQLTMLADLAKEPFRPEPGAVEKWPRPTAITSTRPLRQLGARIVSFAGAQAMQVRYSDGTRDFDVFTIPSRAFPHYDNGWKYRVRKSGLILAGWVENDQLRCIVTPNESLLDEVTLVPDSTCTSH